jgi:multiple sugar transport system ATP-binding protein
MADRIGVLSQGRLVQIGTPADIYDRPATTFVATLVGSPRINLLDAHHADGVIAVERSELRLQAPEGVLPASLLVGIRPEDVKLNAAGAFAGQVALTEPLGVETILHIRTGECTLLSLLPGITTVRVNDTVRFDILQERVHCFDATGKRIV